MAEDGILDPFANAPATSSKPVGIQDPFATDAGSAPPSGEHSYLGASGLAAIPRFGQQMAESLAGGARFGIQMLNPLGPLDIARGAMGVQQTVGGEALDIASNQLVRPLVKSANQLGGVADRTMADLDPGAQAHAQKKYMTTNLSGAAYTDLPRVTGDVIQNAPNFIVSLLMPALRARSAAAIGEAGLADAAKQFALESAANEGAIGYGQEAAQGRARVAQAKGTDGTDLLSQHAADTAGGLGGAVDATTEAVGGPVLGKVFAEGGPFARRIITGLLSQGTVETVQGAGEQLGENYAIKNSVNPKQDLMEGVGENAISSGVVGGIMGGAGAGVVGRSHPGTSAINPDEGSGNAGAPTSDPFVSRSPTLAQGEQGDLFTMDRLLDHGIAPVESSGRAGVVSEAGAAGKYQLTPATARQEAAKLGIPYDPEKLKNDPEYGKQLAENHLRGLIDKYDGDKFLAVMAYNAGQGNVDSWMNRFGYDPSDPSDFLSKVREAGNPRSAAYPQKVAAALGVQDLNGTRGETSPAPAADTLAGSDGLDTSQSTLASRLRASLLDDEGQPMSSSPQVQKTSAALSKSLGNADVDAARSHLTQETAKIDKAVQALAAEQTDLHEAKGEHTEAEQTKYQQALDDRLEKLIQQAHVIGAGHEVVNRFEAALQQNTPRQGDLFTPPATPAAPAPQAAPPAVPVAPATPNLVTETPQAPFGRRPTLPVEEDVNRVAATPPEAARQTELAQQLASEVSAHETARKAVLDTVLEDKATRDPTRRFVAGLKRLGMEPTIRADEAERIAKHEEDRNTRELPSAPDESGNFGIPERGAPRPAQAPQAAEATGVAEPTVAAAPAPQDRVEQNVRQRAEDHADTLGSSRRAWFLRGVDAETGTHPQEAPAAGTRKTWFEEGQRFVREEGERQAREQEPPKKTLSDRLKERPRAATPAEPSRGGRKAFDNAVAAAEQSKQITPRDGLALRFAAEAAWDQNMWAALDQAVKENGQSAKKFQRGAPALQGDVLPDVRKATAALRQQLDRLGLHDVGVKLASQVEMMMHGGSETTRGMYKPYENLIRVAMDGDTTTLNHEAIHALREMDLFSDAEWMAMEQYATGTRDGAWARATYADLSEEGQREEAVAEAYAHWVQRQQPVQGLVQKAFQAIRNVFHGIERAFNINGFRKAEDVFRAIQSGQVGSRFRGLNRSEGVSAETPRFRQDVPPGPVRRANVAIARVVENTAKTGHLWATFTKDIANMAKEFLPSAQRLIELHSANHGLSRQFEQRILEIKDAYHTLPAALKGNGKGSVNEFLYDSRMAAKWGFKPDYQPKAVVDPELSQRFNRMPKAAQDVIKSVLRTNYDLRNQLYKETVGAINAEYDPLVAAATTPEQAASIGKDKATAMANMSRVFDTRDGLPYTPLKRDGQWAVIGRSNEYMAAKRANDKEAMDKLRSDPAHYFVDFRDTVHEAGALYDKLGKAFPKENNAYFNRGNITEGQIGGRELYLAFAQLKEAVAGELRDNPGSEKAKALHRLATDLYLHTLSDTSARKGELHAELVPGKDPEGNVIDMMKAFVTRGQASTHYVASIANSAEMQKTLVNLKEEVSRVEGPKATDAHRFHNELLYRYVKNLSRQPNRVVDKATKAVSLWNLLLSPAYHLTNALQNAQLAHPVLAGDVGYDKASSHFARAYADFVHMTKGIALTQRMRFDAAPADVRPVLQRLAETGHLDAGLSQDLGHWEMNGDGMVPQLWNKVDAFTRNLPQRVEVGNRVTAGIAAYRAILEKTGDPEKAFQYAAKLIDDAHGDYSGFNAPTPFHWGSGTFGKIALQFRKFQLVTASLMVKEFDKAFTKQNSTKEERNAARLTLAYLAAHTVALGGAVALPGASIFGLAISAALHAIDKDKRDDYRNWKLELQKALGAGEHDDGSHNILADLLFKGAPYALLHTDMSGKVGLGDTFSPAPFIDMDKATGNRDDMYSALGQFLSGALGGLAAKGVDAWGYAQDDQLGRAFATVMPNGMIAGSLKAMQQRAAGVQTKSGDTLIKPEDISGLDAFLTAVGLQPSDLVDSADRRSETYEATQHYQTMATHLKRQFDVAARNDDAETQAGIREKWQAMQSSMDRQGFKPTPLSALYKAPGQQMKREGNVDGGVEVTKGNRRFVDDLTN